MLKDLIERIEEIPIEQLTKELEKAGIKFVKRMNG